MSYNVKFLKGTAAGYAALTKDANTFYHTTDDNNLYLGSIKLSNAQDLADAVARIAQNEKDIEAIEKQLTDLVGEGTGSIKDMIATSIATAKTELEAKIKVNTDAIAAINDEETGILKTAKDHADEKVKALEDGKVKANADAIAKLDGADTVEGSVKAQIKAVKTELEGKITDSEYDDTEVRGLISANTNAINAHKEAVDGKVTTLVGEDTGKSVRTIANEELAKQLIAEGAKESLDTLAEIAAWIQSHPEDASAMNKAIEDLQKLVGTLPEDVEATTIVGYIVEAVAAEKARAEAAEKALSDRITDLETAVGEGGSVDAQIDAKIAELDADVTSAAVEEGKGVQVQVVEVDGKVTSVAVTGNFDNSYDAKGAAATAEANAKADATTKANTAETNAKAYADGLAGNYDVAGSASAAEQNAKAYTDTALSWGTF